MSKKGYLLGVLFLCVVGACNQISIESVEELEQLAYAEESPYRTTIEQSGIRFELIYQPAELLLLHEYKYLQELIIKGKPEQQILKQKQDLQAYTESFEQLVQFKLIITPTDDSDLVYAQLSRGFDTYSNWLQRLLFGLKEEIHLEMEDGTEVPLANYQMDRNYGVSPSRSFILSFPAMYNGKIVLEEQRLTLEIGEFGLGTGLVQFRQQLPYPSIQLKGV